MRSTIRRTILSTIILLQACAIVECGGGATNPAAPMGEVSISPSSATVLTNQTVQFTATVTGALGATLTWSVNGVAGGNSSVGAVNSTGLYTAPAATPNPDPVKVEAALGSEPGIAGSASVTVSNPAPELTSISPVALFPGATAATLTLSGSNFTPQSAVSLGTTVAASTFIGSGKLTATVPAAVLASPGAVSVTVSTPAPGGGTSSPLTLTVLGSGVVSATKNPQVAQYSLTLPAGSSMMVEFGTDTAYGRNTWSEPAPSGGGAVNILVAGMKAFTAYHLRAVATLPDGSQYVDSDHVFTTGGPGASRLPNLTVTQPGSLPPNGGIELLDLVLGSSNIIEVGAVDLEGNLIWYYDLENAPGFQTGHVVNPIKLQPDGTMLMIISNPALGLAPEYSVLRKIDLAGNTLWELTLDQLNQKLATAGFNLTVTQFHHDFAVLPNGHVILITANARSLTNLPGYGTTTVVGDALVDLDTNLNPVWVWNEFDHLDVNRHPLGLPDWTHSNAVLYSPSDGNLILSSRHQSWLIKIDYSNGAGDGDILWRLGYQGDFTLQGGTDPIDWFYAQHYPSLLTAQSSGLFTLTVFDNGDDRVLDSSGAICGAAGEIPCYSRVPIFEIDEAAKTAQILWQDKLPVYSFFGGSADQLANGDVEFDETTTYPALTPLGPFVPPFGAKVFEVTHDVAPQTVWELDINGQDAYRAVRIPSLYPGVQW